MTQLTQVYPVFGSLDNKIAITNTARIVQNVALNRQQNVSVVDDILTAQQLFESINKGIFGEKFIPRKPEDGATSARNGKSGKANSAEIHISDVFVQAHSVQVSMLDYQADKTIKQLVEQSIATEEQKFNKLNEQNKQQCETDEKEAEAKQLKSAKATGKEAKQQPEQQQIFHSVLQELLDINSAYLNQRISSYITSFTQSILKLNYCGQSDGQLDFSLDAFKAFIEYQEGNDDTLNKVQKLLESQIVEFCPHFTLESRKFVELYSFRQAQQKCIILSGKQNVNLKGDKMEMLLKQKQQFREVSPQSAIKFIAALGINALQPEFWKDSIADTVPELEAAKVAESPQMGEAGKSGKASEIARSGEKNDKNKKQVPQMQSSDYIAFTLRYFSQHIVGQQVSEESAEDTLVNALNGQDDAYLLAFAVSLELSFTQHFQSIIFSNFDSSETTACAFGLLQELSFTKLVDHFIGADCIKDVLDNKKAGSASKGQINLFSIQSTKKQQLNSIYEIDNYLNHVLPNQASLSPVLIELSIAKENSKLAQRKEIFDSYYPLMEIISQEISFVATNKLSNSVDISSNYQNLKGFVPQAVDVSSIFISKSVLKRTILLNYVQLSDSVQSGQQVTGKEKSKNMTSQTEIEIKRNNIFASIDSYSSNALFTLIQKVSCLHLEKLLEKKFSEFLLYQDYSKQYNADALMMELDRHAIFSPVVLDAFKLEEVEEIKQEEEKQKQQNSNQNKQTEKHEKGEKNEKIEKAEKSQSKNKLQQQIQETILESHPINFNGYIEKHPLFLDQLAELERASSQIKSLKEQHDIILNAQQRQAEEQQQKDRLKLQGVDNLGNFENNSFGSACDLNESNSRNNSHDEIQEKQEINKSLPENVSKTSVLSTKQQKPVKLSARQQKELDEKMKKDEQERIAKEQAEEQAKAESARKEAETQKIIQNYAQYVEIQQYLQQNGLQKDIEKALSALMLAIQSGMIEPSDQIQFLGDELVQIWHEKNDIRKNDSDELYKRELNDEGEKVPEQEEQDVDPVIAEMQQQIIQ